MLRSRNLFGLLLGLCAAAASAFGADYFVYASTYNSRSSPGIYALRFDTATGKLKPMALAVATLRSSFLAVHPNHRVLYTVNEVSNVNGVPGGGISAFAIDPAKGELRQLNIVNSGGAGPTHLSVDKTGKALVVANYAGGSVAVVPIGPDGSLKKATTVIQHSGSSVNKDRQEGPHAHCVVISPDNRFVLAADLGTDQIFTYRLSTLKPSLTPAATPFIKAAPGAGPRHIAFHPNGRFVYVINELASTVAVYAYTPLTGALHELQTISTLPEDFKGTNTAAEVAVSASGKFLYASNRGHDSIAVFSIDAKTGKLATVQTVPTQGKTPRNFAIDPTGAYLLAANQDSSNIAVFKIDPESGQLTAGDVVEAPTPVSLVFVPAKAAP